MTQSIPSDSLPTKVPASTHNSCAISIALLFRLAVGATFIFAGSQKLFGVLGGPGIEAFSHYLDMPAFLPPIAWAYMAALGEFIGGISVLLGLLTRLGTLPLLVTMFVAIATATGKNGFMGYYDPVKGMQVGYAFNVALIAMSAALLIAGPGKLSLDALLFHKKRSSHD